MYTGIVVRYKIHCGLNSYEVKKTHNGRRKSFIPCRLILWVFLTEDRGDIARMSLLTGSVGKGGG